MCKFAVIGGPHRFEINEYVKVGIITDHLQVHVTYGYNTLKQHIMTSMIDCEIREL